MSAVEYVVLAIVGAILIWLGISLHGWLRVPYNFLRNSYRRFTKAAAKKGEESKENFIAKLFPEGAFEKHYPTVFFIVALAFVTVYFIVMGVKGVTFATSFEGILYNTTLGALLELMISGVDFSVATLVSAGFVSFATALCIKPLDEMPFWKKIPFFAVTVCLTAILGNFFSSFLTALADWGVALYNSLETALFLAEHNTFWDYCSIAGMIVLLIILIIIVVLLFLIASREYLACVRFGFLPLSLFLLFGVVITSAFNKTTLTIYGTHWTEYVVLLLLFAAIIAAEAWREWTEDREG